MDINEIIQKSKQCYAHRKKHSKEEEIKETLYIHLKRTYKSFKYIVKRFQLEPIIKNLLTKNIQNNEIDEHLIKDIYKVFKLSILIHDLGKLNTHFQQNKMCHTFEWKDFQEKTFQKLEGEKLKEVMIDSSSDHSRFNILEYFIKKNHSNPMGDRKKRNLNNDLIKFGKIFIENHHNGLIKDIIIDNFFKTKELKVIFKENSFLLELLHSILINADVIATKYFMENNTNIVGLKEYLENYLKNYGEELVKILPSVEEKQNYNKITYDNIKNNNLLDFDKDVKSLNGLRNYYAQEIVDNLSNEEKKKNVSLNKINFLKGKVGIGKTNLFLLLSNEIVKRKNISKIVYISPLNVLIDQTKEVLLNSTDFKEHNISIINAEERSKNKINMIQNNDNTTNYVDSYLYENFNNTFVFSSAVNFFQKLINKEKKDIAPLIYLKDSLIVIDEIQLINDKLFNLIYQYLKYLNDYLNCTIVIMSATIPIPLFTKENILKDEIEYLIEVDKQNQINNSAYLDRFKYNTNCFKNEKNAFQEIMKKEPQSILIVHNSINKLLKYYKEIEKELEQMVEDGYEILFYNNNIIKPQNDLTIQKIKEGKKVIVFATKKIETGVDVSLHYGIKFISPFDEIEQFGGRINRNQTFDNSEVYVIEDDSIYFEDQKRTTILKSTSTDLGITKEYLGKIDKYYEEIFNNQEDTYISQLNGIKHQELNQIKLIKEQEQHKFIIDIKFDENNENFKELKNYMKPEFIKFIDENKIENSKDLFVKSKEWFYKNAHIKEYQSYFIIKGFINNKSNFYKDSYKNLEEIDISIKDSYKDIYKVLNEDNFYYDIKLGIQFNKEVEEDYEDIGDLYNL